MAIKDLIPWNNRGRDSLVPTSIRFLRCIAR